MDCRIRKRSLGATGLELSELGFGGAPVGNLFRSMSEGESCLTLEAARAAGITYFDTAPYYGFGLSERRVGDGIRSDPNAVVSTKVGRILHPLPGDVGEEEREGFLSSSPFEAFFDYTYEGVRRSWESSLQRLGLSRTHILYVHDIGTRTHGERGSIMFAQLTEGGGFRALEELRAAGAIRAFGLGVNEWKVCLLAMQHTRLDVVLLAGRYTLLEQDALDEFLPACSRAGVSVVLGGVYNSGILATGTHTGGVAYFDYAPASTAVIERVRALESVCNEHGIALPAAALQFALAHPAVVSVVLGLASPQQVSKALQSYSEVIPEAFWIQLKTSGLLRSDAPTPGAVLPPQ